MCCAASASVASSFNLPMSLSHASPSRQGSPPPLAILDCGGGLGLALRICESGDENPILIATLGRGWKKTKFPVI